MIPSVRSTLPWAVGVADGLLAIAIVQGLYLAAVGDAAPALPLWLVAACGGFTAWRASVYVRGLLSRSASHVQPPAEGFALMALTLIGYGAYRVLWSGLDGGSPIAAMLQFAVLAIPAGLFGALVAGVLMLLDLLVVGAACSGDAEV